MNITIQDIVTLNARGQRPHNEDSLFPEEHLVSSLDALFMVCDGVGGNPGGDRASQLVCQHFSNYMLGIGDAFQTQEVLGDALAYSEQGLDEYVDSYPEYEGMATTLTYLSLTAYGAVVAWVGDSRVIQIREGRVIRQTKDHSLVNALLDYGEITEEEVVVHPKRNVLLRAVSSSKMPSKLDILYIDDIMPADYFMLCSDGIIDGLGDQLEAVFSESFSTKQLKNDIDDLCRKNTTDNYSMILMRIRGVTFDDDGAEELAVAEAVAMEEEEAPRSARVDGPEDASHRRAHPYLILLMSMVVVFLGWWLWSSMPIPLQVILVGDSGVMVKDDGQTVLIDAFPLSDKIRKHQLLESTRLAMLQGKPPFEEVSLFLVSHRPNLESGLIEPFLRQYLENNEQIQLYPKILKSQLDIGRALFQDLGWREGELTKDSSMVVERLPVSSADTSVAAVDFSTFILRMNQNKTLLYAGDPNVDIDFLANLEETIDYVLINEWSLRLGAARRVLLSKFKDDQFVIIPSGRPMNNRQREDIRNIFPAARFLSEEMERVRLK